MKYIIDANALIDAKDFYYRFAICPGFWDWLGEAVQGQFGTVDHVVAELLKGNDELAEWFKVRKGASWIAATNGKATQDKFGLVAAWVVASGKRQPEQDKFLAGADPWLLAHAMATKATLVTMETAKSNQSKKLSLANACEHFGVQTLKTWDLLELLKVRFIREK